MPNKVAFVGKWDKYVGRGASLEHLPPVLKSSASLGKGSGGKHLVTNRVTWSLVSHTSAAQ